MSDYFMARLSQMEFKQPATVRIKGLAISVNLGDAEYASKVSAKCRRAGLLVTSEDQALTMFPALNIDQKLARKGLDITGAVPLKFQSDCPPIWSSYSLISPSETHPLSRLVGWSPHQFDQHGFAAAPCGKALPFRLEVLLFS